MSVAVLQIGCTTDPETEHSFISWASLEVISWEQSQALHHPLQQHYNIVTFIH